MDGTENVMKQGYLKKGTSGIVSLSNLFKRLESNKWFVFTIRDRVPFLEYYDRDVDVFTQHPINTFNLSACSNIKPMGSSRPFVFCVVCDDRVLELIASSRSQMLEWVNIMESSLRRLGILKTEVNDHVYTVCPAVVRQPRVSKEVQEERDAVDQATRDAPAAASAAEETPPQITLRHPVMAESAEDGDGKPAVPSRLYRSNLRSQRTKTFPSWTPSQPGTAQDEDGDIPVGSNDSDFVSPDVIREIRRSHSQRASAIVDLNSDIHATHFQIAAYFANEKQHSEKPHLENEQEVFPKTSSDHILNDTFDEDFSLCMANINQNSDPVENHYSQLPSDLNGSSICEEGDEEIHGTCHQVKSQSLPKPVPRPRKAASKRFTDDEVRDQMSRLENISTKPVNHLSNSDILGNENSVSDLSGEGESDVSVLGINHSNTVDISERQDLSENVDILESRTKEDKDQSSKDENENIYGLTFDLDRPPSIVAPPIPPLPSRFVSSPSTPAQPPLYATTSTASQTDTKASLTKVPLSQVEDVPPPLPQPRKREHKSTSAFTANGSIDIPPMPPRRHSPNRSASCDDKPPALPSRHSQSFVIKRPQLVNPGSLEGDSSTSAPHSKAMTLDRGLTNYTSPQAASSAAHGDSGKGTSGLSRKMLLDRSHSLHTVVSLKQTQAEILQHEIGMTGVTVTLTQKSGHGLALVDWMDSPCIVGWNQKDFHSLHGKLHIGDLLFSINKVRVTSADLAQKLLKQCSELQIEVVLRRMPYAKVFAIRRNAEGQSLGIKREGGTGEIVYVDPNGLAAQHGLSQHATSARTGTRCNWFLTEINNRSLNLFFKENEIDHRLSAVGREISIVVQPSDFIFEIRKLFKKLKNYKSFIVQ